MSITRLSFKERKLIQKLINENLSLSEISRKLNRSKNCVVVEVRVNGGRSSYTADDAQNRSDLANFEKRNNLHKLNKNVPKVFLYKERIQNLEMQIEILIDKIKELSND